MTEFPDGPAGTVPEDLSTVAPRLRDLRRRSGLTLETAARLVGLSPAHLSRLETNQRQPSLPMLLALFLQGESLKDIQRALIEYSVPSALAALYDIPFLPTGPSGWTPVGILAGVTAVALGGAYAAMLQRDV